MEHTISFDELNQAFDRAEQETADWFNGQTCSMKNREGHDQCPICFFRQRVKILLNEGMYEHDPRAKDV